MTAKTALLQDGSDRPDEGIGTRLVLRHGWTMARRDQTKQGDEYGDCACDLHARSENPVRELPVSIPAHTHRAAGTTLRHSGLTTRLTRRCLPALEYRHKSDHEYEPAYGRDPDGFGGLAGWILESEHREWLRLMVEADWI